VTLIIIPIRRPSEAERRPAAEREERREAARARGRRSARGDDSPRIRELSREGSRVRRQQEASKAAAAATSTAVVASPAPAPSRQPYPARAASADSRGRQAPAPSATSSAGDLAGRPAKPKKPVVMTDPPSWHELKTRALEADFAAIERFVGENGGFASDEARTRDPPTFDDWFRARFPENNLSSAPSAHKALWAEHERQLRWTSEERTKAGAVDFVTPEPDDGGGGYLSRLRKNSQNPAAKRAAKPAPAARTPLVLRSGSTKRLNASGSQTHTVTWKVERWSALPSGFRQGARYRPPGGAPWSLDLYKGGIKRERPGMVALYVHYDAPSDRSFARVASLELSLLHQNGGSHLTRKHEGQRVFGAKADQAKRISTSAGTASLAHVVLTQVEALGFCVNDAVVLRAEIEIAADSVSL